ncbi:MAG: DUF4019 domain-containing protein [Desulfobacterales bacterium]
MASKIAGLIAISLLLWVAPHVMSSETEKEAAALSAALAWLDRVDQGSYAESWQAAAEYFKTAVNKDQWVESLKAGRAPLGKLVSRAVGAKSYQTALPGAPDGEYVVIQFKTAFENKKAALETVTPMREANGTWRVSGYYIK